MLVLNVPLSAMSVLHWLVVFAFMWLRKIAAQSSKYFHDQQNDLGRVNGFIEEMMDGQKLLKFLTMKNVLRKISENLTKNFVNQLQMPISLRIS